MEHSLFVFLIYVIAIVAFVAKALRKARGKDMLDGGNPPATSSRPRYNPPRRMVAEESEQERLRKFMEALGVPTTVETPRKIERPPQPAPRVRPAVKIETPKPPYVPKAATPPPAPVPRDEPEFSPYEQPPAPAPPSAEEAAAVFKTLSVARPEKSVASSAETGVVGVAGLADLQSLLKSPASARAAMVLKEILGPPRSLQSFSGAPNLR